MNRFPDPAIARIIDANLNRLKEGLRAVEDYARFVLDAAELTGRIKRMRHGVDTLFSPAARRGLARFRDSRADVGARTRETVRSRKGAADVAAANLKRTEEALRVLEEYLKPTDARAAAACKQLRFETYALEKEMTGPARRLAQARLYVILTPEVCTHGVEETVRMVLDGGADIIQLRDKRLESRPLLRLARRIRKIITGYETLFVINDRPDIARLAGADGVHCGQNDLALADAAAVFPEGFKGASTHSVKQAGAACRGGADYIGIGPVYATPTKQGRPAIGIAAMRNMIKTATVPGFCIGGIDRKTVGTVIDAGARAIAVCRAVIAVPDPAGETRRFKRLLGG